MDFKDTPEQAKFRKTCREWLEKNAKLKTGVEKNEFANIDFLQVAKDWQKKKYDAGWAMLHWPKEFGGIGASAIERIIWAEEESKFNVPKGIFEIGLGMAGPVMMEYATDEQKARYLPAMAEGKEIWCQLFSEPSAGSDVAGLRSKAVKDGDNWIINGQKVWTSYADKADWIFALVRTGPKEPKHDGISFLLIDMETAGVSTKPITLISGKSPFCETFFDDVKVPKENLIGQLNAGWAIAKALLQHERAFISSFGLGSGMGSGRDLVSIAKKHVGEEDGKISNGFYRSQIASHKIKEHAFGLTFKRAKDEGGKASATASMFKLYGTEHNKKRHELMIAATGINGVACDGDEFDKEDKNLTRAWLRTKGNSIEGGTSEVQLNVISKRVLGLPS